MTLEETRMTIAETLKVVHDIDNEFGDKMQGVRDGLKAAYDKVEGRLQGVEGMLHSVTDMLRDVGDRANDIGDKVINSAQTLQLAMSCSHCLYG